MSDWRFWFDAVATGGALGIYGDLIHDNLAPGYARHLTDYLGGPAVELADRAIGGVADAYHRMVDKAPPGRLTLDKVRKLFAGDAAHMGRDLASFMRSWTPGTTIWYARLGVDRLVHDEIQQALDPKYQEAFRRQQKRVKDATGQQYWWKPGTTSPQRPPAF